MAERGSKLSVELLFRPSTEQKSQPAVNDYTASATAQMMNPFSDHGGHQQRSDSGQYPSPDRHTQGLPESGGNLASKTSDTFETPGQFRERQILAVGARRRARERLRSETATFNRFWPSYNDCQQEWRRQREAGETGYNRSAFDRTFLREGQNRTQCLVNAERDYRAAAWDAKDLKVEALSPDQTSVFPSDDGIDQEELDREEEDIKLRLDRTRINLWIQDDWQYSYPSAFDSPDNEPVRAPDPGPAQNAGEGLPALPHVPYGFCEEARALHRQRAHIDLWKNWSHADWRAMLQKWPAMSSNRQGVPISPPDGVPNPDSIRPPTDSDGEDDDSIAY